MYVPQTFCAYVCMYGECTNVRNYVYLYARMYIRTYIQKKRLHFKHLKYLIHCNLLIVLVAVVQSLSRQYKKLNTKIDTYAGQGDPYMKNIQCTCEYIPIGYSINHRRVEMFEALLKLFHAIP